jgi:hypothetical protein
VVIYPNKYFTRDRYDFVQESMTGSKIQFWAATTGVNKETLLVNFSEDLQIDIRRHLFNFIKKVCNKIYFYYSYDY